jgi:quinolinate synthase
LCSSIKKELILSETTFQIKSTAPLKWSPAIGKETAHIYERMKRVVPEAEWMLHAPYIHAINRLKRERNAVILAHNYQVPEIYHGVADVVGDSLYLAKQAALTSADIIVQGGVHFMAETSKLLCPDKTVLIPDSRAGCSLAESITGADVRALRAKHPGVPVVAYVNTSADVKAEVDICCTSSNAVQVVESLGVPVVMFLPDQYLAANVAAQTKVKIISWAGACEVHERFTAEEIREYRAAHPGIEIIGHPECPPEVIAECDFSGSTAAMIKYVKDRKPKQVLMVTECTMSDNVAAETPDVDFIRPCNFCPHMRRITLPAILNSLQHLTEEVRIEPALAERARASVQRMIDLK